MIEANFVPKIHLNSGIPVLEFEGDWDESFVQSLLESVSGLTRAGHFEIVLNLSRLKLFSFNETRRFETLERLIQLCTQSVRLDIIATKELIGSFLKTSLTHRIKWATSEDEAIGQLKGVACHIRAELLEMRLI